MPAVPQSLRPVQHSADVFVVVFALFLSNLVVLVLINLKRNTQFSTLLVGLGT